MAGRERPPGVEEGEPPQRSELAGPAEQHTPHPRGEHEQEVSVPGRTDGRTAGQHLVPGCQELLPQSVSRAPIAPLPRQNIDPHGAPPYRSASTMLKDSIEAQVPPPARWIPIDTSTT